MNRNELETWLEYHDDVMRTRDWIAANTVSYEDTVDMIEIFLNSNPDNIDFSQEFICFDESRENKRGCSTSVFTLDADEVVALIESGDLPS